MTVTLVHLDRVSPERFAVFYDIARNESDQIREATSPFSHDGGAETFYYLHRDGKSGFCVRADRELVFVFSVVKGRGDSLVRAALDRGATHLDCFDGYLPTLYSRHGFVEVTRLPNWTEGEPAVVYMAVLGGVSEALDKAGV